MTAIPATYLDAAIAAARPGRDFNTLPLTAVEQRELLALYRAGFTAEQVAHYLAPNMPVRFGGAK